MNEFILVLYKRNLMGPFGSSWFNTDCMCDFTKHKEINEQSAFLVRIDAHTTFSRFGVSNRYPSLVILDLDLVFRR